MEFYQRIRDLREDNDKTQQEIAKILNMSQTNYAKIENNKNGITINNLKKLCYFYNVSADYILGFTNKIRPLPKK